MRKLSRFCMNNKICAFMITHLNRDKRSNDKSGMPTNDRIYGSGSLAQAATKVILLSEEEEAGMNGERYIRARLTKSRYTRVDKRNAIRFNATEETWQEETWHNIGM